MRLLWAALLAGSWSGQAFAAALVLPPITVTQAAPSTALISQIHNAPGWLPNHNYAPATRINAGPGWNPATGAWNPGQPLAAYRLTSDSCVSGSVMPSGTGATISDGSCQWRYLSPTDYVTITGWGYDNRPWAAGTFQPLDIVTSGVPLRAYILGRYDARANPCASTVAPAGIAPATGDGCAWQYLADVLYTSGRSYIPTQTLVGGAFKVNMTGNAIGQLWNDGAYVGGMNGEMAPLNTRFHNDYEGEGATLIGCPATGCYRIILTAAPGEGFASNPSPPTGGVDQTKGVILIDNLGITFPIDGGGFAARDNATDLIGLQIQSTKGEGVAGTLNYSNDSSVQNCIVDGGWRSDFTMQAAISLDTGGLVSNTLVIARGSAGVAMKYPGHVLWSTIVSPARDGDVGIITGNTWVFDPSTVGNTAIFGFAHAGAENEAPASFNARSGHNVTDAPPGDGGLTAWGGTASNSPVVPIPGTTYGANINAAFMAPGTDWRPKPGGPMIGAGAAFGAFSEACETNAVCPQDMNVDATDIVGGTRPGANGYDIGAWQTPGGSP